MKSPLPGAKFIFLTAASCKSECHYGSSCQIWSKKNIKSDALSVLQQLLKSYFGTIEEAQSEKPDGFRIDYIIVLEFFKNSIAICFSDKIPVKIEKIEGS